MRARELEIAQLENLPDSVKKRLIMAGIMTVPQLVVHDPYSLKETVRKSGQRFGDSAIMAVRISLANYNIPWEKSR